MPECYADTLLIETLVPTKTGYNHKHSCFKVEASMRNSDKFAVGIIDNDKKQILYLKNFEIVAELNDLLKLWYYKEKSQFIIQICPALEKWILSVCDEEKINVESFGLINSLDGLKSVTKQMSSLKNANLKNLFSTISKKDNNVAVRKLKGWLKLLKEKNYQVDINELRNV